MASSSATAPVSKADEVRDSWSKWWTGSVSATAPAEREPYYVTTAINYTNGLPHLGHAYEAISSDIIARYHRIFGRDAHFVTGTDEHGQKIAARAETEGVTPLEVATKYANAFQALNKELLVSNDDFIRTTEERHIRCAQWLLQRAIDAGDVYLDGYKGWYNVREEAFVTEKDAEQSDYKDPETGVAYVRMEEDSYFFRMSKYQQTLVDHIKANPGFIQPASARDLILSRLERDDSKPEEEQPVLRDLSISRTTFDWGIPFPSDPKHVMYVWFDALTNYLSAIDYDQVYGNDVDGTLGRLWPANVHVIGKDIAWFHTVIWPCMLLSTGLTLPRTIFAHGFVTDREGKKMSKSVGNVVDPNEVLAKFPVDSFRYYLATLSHFGSDPPYDADELVRCHDANLAGKLGNLVVRVTKLCQSYNGGKVPASDGVDVVFDLAAFTAKTDETYARFGIKDATDAAMEVVADINTYLTEKEPWKHGGDKPFQLRVVRSTLEAIYAITHFLAPVIPQTAMEIFQSLNQEPVCISSLSAKFDNLKDESEIQNTFRFKPLTEREDKKKQADAAKSVAAAKKAKKQKQQQNQQKDAQEPFTKLSIKVGEITKVWKHPDSQKLYCEEIDVGLDEPLQVASGLQEHYTLEEMQNRRCLVFCNLRPATLGGFKSFGMVLCAVKDGKTEFVTPPEGAKVGERIFCDGLEGEPAAAAHVRKKKVLEAVLPELKTDSSCVAQFRGLPLLTSAGPCTVPTNADAPLQ